MQVTIYCHPKLMARIQGDFYNIFGNSARYDFDKIESHWVNFLPIGQVFFHFGNICRH